MYDSIAPWYEDVFPVGPKLGFVASRLAPASHVLDVGCATGELGRGLAGRGHTVLGVDLDEAMIALGQQRAPAGLELRVGDMRTLWQELEGERFDAVLCLGNTLVHLDGPAEIHAFLEGARRALVPGGLLVVQTIHYDRGLAEQMDGLPTLERERVRFQREYVAEGAHLRFTTTLTVRETGRALRSSVRLYPLRVAELLQGVEDFDAVEVFGGYDGCALGPRSLPLVVVARTHATGGGWPPSPAPS